jgi:NADPH:quinone reductase
VLRHERNGKGVDLIVDRSRFANQNLKATKTKARIINVGRLGGTHGDFQLRPACGAPPHNYIGVAFRTREGP